uniref:Kinesin-like protein n=1 Tax=Strongyloides papillosus TaxID=174720 RepID=A0A0N5CD08_STREA
MSSFLDTSSISYGKGGKSCIKVGIRIRPRNLKEIDENDPLVLCIVEPSTIILTDEERERIYSGYDFVFDECVTQCQLYKEMVAEYIPQLLFGYNCTIFAYGQTGTGKTFTMEGNYGDLNDCDSFKWDSDNYVGVTSRAMQHIFTILNLSQCIRKKVTVMYIELYNEEVYDLLGNDITRKLKIFEDNQNLGSVYIKDVKECEVNNMHDVNKILQHGASMRQTATTSMNQRSSRSHAIFTAVIEWDEITNEGTITRKGKINLVDLAGSENIGKSGATKGSAREAGNINTSLLALGQVINALTEKNSHIPYRSSKLTRILKDSLGGSALTCLIGAVSPTFSNKGETISTLEYGLKAMNVENNIRANVRARRDKYFPAYSILNDYLQSINGHLRNYSLGTHRNKLLSIVDKDLFSKIDNFILKRDDISEEAHKWLAADRDFLCNFGKKVDFQTKLVNEGKLSVINLKSKIKLLKNEVEVKLRKLKKLEEKSNNSIKTSQSCQNELSYKTNIFEEKILQAKELLQKRQNFLEEHLRNIHQSLAMCETMNEETIFKINAELKKIEVECKSILSDLMKENDDVVDNATETAMNILSSIKKENELISIAEDSQDKLIKSFNIKRNKFNEIISSKFKELEEIENLNVYNISSCDKRLKACNKIDEDIELINKYTEEIRSYIRTPEKSKSVLLLEEYIVELDKK